MRLTTKGRFAVTAMIDLAMRHHLGPVTLAGISQRQKISLSYLEQLFGKLRRQMQPAAEVKAVVISTTMTMDVV
jgi:DNA-binding IscR family transcriptional regulator